MSSIPTLNDPVPALTPSKQQAKQQPNQLQQAAGPQSRRRTAQEASLAARRHFKEAGRWLVDIPLSIIAEHSAWTSSGSWQGTFDCAVWLRTPGGLQHPAQLALKYIDNGGEKVIAIDRCQPGSHRTILLNGSINIAVNGRIQTMALFLMDASDTVIALEEWHVTPQQRHHRG